MKILKYTLSLLILLTFSCSDDYFDVNGSETAPTTTSLAPQYRIQGAIENTIATAQYRGAREIIGVTQYAAHTSSAYDSDSWTNTFTTGRYFLWQNAYVYALPNTADLIVLGGKFDAPNYTAVGKILRAYIFGMTSDQYGDIVTEETYDGESNMNITPKFVTQKQAYQTIFDLLDEAIDELQLSSPIGLNVKDGDVLYEGNQENWIRFAQSLKARYLNHLSKKTSGEMAYNPDAIIEACEAGINSNALNAKQGFVGGEAENQRQPFAEGGYGSSRFRFFSSFFVDLLKNPLNLSIPKEDPRLSIIVPEAANGGYVGLDVGRGLAGDSSDDYSIGNGGFYTSPTSPTYMLCYSEVKFIEAEARYRKNDLTGAYIAFRDGVKGDMEKLNVSTDAVNDYLFILDSEIGAININLSYIMTQKYIANMLNPETWVDMRRMDYNSEIYPGLQRPANVNLDIFPGSDEWIQGMMYEYNEEDRNYVNMPSNDPLVRLKTPLWWNTGNE